MNNTEVPDSGEQKHKVCGCYYAILFNCTSIFNNVCLGDDKKHTPFKDMCFKEIGACL